MYDQDIQSIIDRTQGKRTPLQKGANAVGRFGALLTGHSPDKDGATRLADQMALMSYKQSIEDPAEKAMKQDYLKARTENARRGPFWASDPGQAYYQARTGQASAQGQQAQTETDIMNQVKDQLGNGQTGPSNITPGTTVQAGPYNIPLNPKLTESEQGVIGGVQSMEPMIGEISESLKQDKALDTPFGDFGRTFQQMRADRQSALFTSTNPKLQQLQSKLNTLKKTIPFTEGGKQLTETEKSMVMALLNISGKPDTQIMTDINQAMGILRAKEKLALGGRNAAIESKVQPSQVGGYDPDKESRYQAWKKSQAAVSTVRG